MSHFIMVPITGQGIITDTSLRTILPEAMKEPFEFSDVFLYSHGWWTNAEAAMVDYYRFSLGLAGIVFAHPDKARRPAASLGVGVHWPAMISEDSRSILVQAQLLTYFNRRQMADDVGTNGGYTLLRLILEGRKAAKSAEPPRIHLVGHSFGCRVVCAALQHLAVDKSTKDLIREPIINVVLLQAAFDHDDLGPDGRYRDILKLPKVRVLLTTSGQDKALNLQYQLAQKVNHFFGDTVPALGATGPDQGTVDAVGAANANALAVDTGFDPAALPAAARDRLSKARLVVADLSQLHLHDKAYEADNFGGYHSDIFLPEIYRLVVAHLFASAPPAGGA